MSLEVAKGTHDALTELLRAYGLRTVARGRAYFDEGRVANLRRDAELARAVVVGTARYDVSIAFALGRAVAECTCPGFEREQRCKHVAALACALIDADGDGDADGERNGNGNGNGGAAARAVGSGRGALAQRFGAPRADAGRIPEIVRNVYVAPPFLARLALYTGERLELDEPARALGPLDAWFRRSAVRPTPAGAALRDALLAHADTMRRDVEALRAWVPPPAPPEARGNAFGELYAALARSYLRRRGSARVLRVPPGPLDERHPGFDLSYDASSRALHARERKTPLLDRPLHFAVHAPLDGDGAADGDRGADGGGLTSSPYDHGYGPADAWDVMALRAMLRALAERTDPAVVALERDLARPAWERMLERLGAPDAASRAPSKRHTWAFALAAGYDGLSLYAYARPVPPPGSTRPPAKWKGIAFERAYDEDTDPADREVARLAQALAASRSEAHLYPETAQGHELLRALATHPRVTMGTERRPDPESSARVDLVVGTLTMRLERGLDAALSPRFFVGDREVPPALLEQSSTSRGSTGAFRGGVRGNMIVSAFVPAPLRPWLEMAERAGAALSFPPEAVPRLARATEALVSAGLAELPRDALGYELDAEPRAALRVEWRVEGSAVVELLVSPHPRAPLVAAGDRPALLTFEADGRRVFVERDLDAELELVAAARETITVPLAWAITTGRTESVDDAVALARWLHENPLGMRIEVKIGKTPKIVEWEELPERTLRISREGGWLVLDGDIGAKGVKLTVGDVLEAARLARRYVRASDGTFLELSERAASRLRPVAAAVDLAASAKGGGGDDEPLRMHDAFGAALLEAGEVFERVDGPPLAEYARRFEARGAALKVPKIEGKLRGYQKDGVKWLLALATWAPGAVLADDMGLGKTVQTAAVLKARASLGPSLVVAPTSVTTNWVAELARFVPSLRVRFYNEDRAAEPVALGAGDVLVVSYGLLQKQTETFVARRWATLVVDEAQYVKNVAAQRTDAVRALERDFAIVLTGTPLENHLGELFSVVSVAFPGLLGDEGVFRERFRRPIEGGAGKERLAGLTRLIAPFLLRRTRADVLQELPPREEITELVDLSAEEKKRYLALRRACEELFAQRSREDTPAQLKIVLLAALMRLRQLACDPRLVDPTYGGAGAKITRAVELCTALASERNHALVFSQFTSFLALVRDALAAAGLRVAYLAGDTPTPRRRELVEAFQNGEYDVFCVSLLAGGTGLNLTRASYVVHLDPWWNPAVEEQATSRAHRMGQSAPVTVYRLVARGTIEEAVLELQAGKRALFEAVLDGAAEAGRARKAVTPAELLDLLRYGS